MRKHSARDGTRTTFQPLQTRGIRGKKYGIRSSSKTIRTNPRPKVWTVMYTPRSRGAMDYRGTKCPEIWAAESSKSMVPAATPTTRSKPSSVAKLCR
jgi:hypothetical protein